jgi:hypothetical protein
MRLAQRAYRARRQEAQESVRNRNEELNRTLDRALAAYSQLHERIICSLQSGDPTGIPQHLDDAAAQMGAIASGANKALVLRPVAAISGPVDPHGSDGYTPFVESEGSTSSHGQRAPEHLGLFSLADAASTLSDDLGSHSVQTAILLRSFTVCSCSRAVCSHCQCLSAVIHLRSFNSPAVIQSGRPWSCSRCSLTAGWRQILQRIRTPGPGREGRDWS